MVVDLARVEYISSAGLGVLKNPWVLLAIAALVFLAIGGHRWLGSKLNLA